jgi:CspA family cold shock protein
MGKRKQGTVSWFNPRKGFGFIKTTKEDLLFVHFSNIDMRGFKKLTKGQKVSFITKTYNQDYEQAFEVRIERQNNN